MSWMIFVKILVVLCGGKEHVWMPCVCVCSRGFSQPLHAIAAWWDRGMLPVPALPPKDQQQFGQHWSPVPGPIPVPKAPALKIKA